MAPAQDLPDVTRAPNQAADPARYELENEAIDPDGTLDAALREVAPWDGRDVLDLGCGTGSWLPYYAATARSVVGVEPDPSLVAAARRRHPPVRAEALRVLRPGGTLVVIDNDPRWGEFADLLAGSAWADPQGWADVTDPWWAARGAARRTVRSGWAFRSRADLAAVLRLEFPLDVADRWLAAHPSATSLTYGCVLFSVTAADAAATTSGRR